MGPEKVIKFEDRQQIRDIYIPLTVEESSGGYQVTEGRLDEAYAFTGGPQARRIFDGSDKQLTQWLLTLYGKSEAGSEKRTNFRLEHDGVMFRAHRAETVEGPVLALRALPQSTPGLKELNMHNAWRELLLDPDLLYGGLVLVTAANGQGKTTTISATVHSRLERYSGFGVAVEDPPELPLHGWHGEGRCEQIPVTTPVGTMPGSGYAQALVDARRYFPAVTGGGTILMIGEIRNAETAAETILAANEGHLVISTFHGSSIQNAIMRLMSMAAEKIGENQARDLLAATLKICMFQRLVLRNEGNLWERGEVQGQILAVPATDSKAADEIRKADLSAISERVKAQNNKLVALPAGASLRDYKSALAQVK